MNDYYKNLRSGKSIPLLNINDIKNLDKPIGKAIYKNQVGRPRKNEDEKAKYNDRIICDICGEKFTRSHRSRHNQNKVHQAYANIHNKLYKVIVESQDDKS